MFTDLIDSYIETKEKEIRSMAIDEFVEKIIELDAEFPTVEDDFGELRPMTIKEMCSVIAEQMKGET